MQINIIKVRTVGVFPFREIHRAERDETWGGTKKEKSSDHGNKKPSVLGVGRKKWANNRFESKCQLMMSEAASNLVQRRDEQKYDGRKKQSSCCSSFQNREHIWSLAELFFVLTQVHSSSDDSARHTQRPAAATCKVHNISGLKWSERFKQRVLSQICFWKILRGSKISALSKVLQFLWWPLGAPVLKCPVYISLQEMVCRHGP